MGMLIDGQWKDFDRTAGDGNYHRKPSSFRNHIGSDARFPAEPGRYHLYVSLACPWASRTIIVRALKHLEPLIGLSVVSPDMLDNGWTLDPAPDPITGADYIHQIYTAADPAFTGTATVPILYDTVARTIVNNESSDIIRNLDHAFDAYAAPGIELYPAALASEIDALNDRIYHAVNNGVYRAGFATTQPAYDAAVVPLFATLDELDARLATTRYLFGDALTETDIRLFTTGIRFDTVYFSHFKCNIRQWRDYTHLSRWLADIYALPGIADTVDLNQIKRHYYFSQRWVNPTGIVPAGPSISLATMIA
ncbi:MAG: glutathione S-transferase family protein [Janthinobacterium lividum]